MAEEILLNIKIEGTENESKINSLTSSIITLQEESKKLAETNKKLAKAEGDNSAEIAKNTSQIEANKQTIAQGNATRKGLIETIKAEDNSIKALSIRNAELIKERNLINTSTEEGRKKIAAINAQLDKNNTVIKENNDALGKQKINIGNYASALDKVVPGLGGMITGLQGATKAALAFIATPIGAILAGVVAALATLKAAILTNDATADEFGKRWAQVSAIFDVVLRRVGLLGDALVSLVKGDFSEAADKASAAFNGVNDELGKAIFLTGELADRQNELDDAVNKFNATEQARKNNIDKLIIQSKDLSKSESERLKLSTQAEALLNKLTEDRIALSIRQSDIDIEAIGLKHDAQRELNETTQQYGLRLLENSAIGGEEAEKIAAAIRKVDEAEAESLRTLEKLQNQQNKLSEEKTLRVIEDSELIKEIRARQVEDDLTIQGEYQEQSTALTTTFEQGISNVKESFRKRDLENQKIYNENIKKQETDLRNTKITSLNLVTQALMSAGRYSKEFAVASVLASRFQAGSEIISNTGVANAKAVAASPLTFGQPWVAINTISAGIGIASLIASAVQAIAGIQSAKFARGGIAAIGGVLNGPSHSNGGIPFAVGGRLGFEAEGGEAIINRRSTAMFGPILSRINQAGGGVAFATGGVIGNEIREASRMAVQSNQLSAIQTVLVLQDFEVAQMAKNQTVQQAIVL